MDGPPQEEERKPDDNRNPAVFIKRWLKFYRLHRSLPQSIAFPTNTSMTIDSTAYMLLIHRIEGLQRPTNQEVTLGVRVIVNMLLIGEPMIGQEKKQSSNKCFFGRTYESPPVPVMFMPDGVSYEHHPVNVYFHTKVQGANSPLVLIVEIQINELQGDLILRRQTLGWMDIPATGLTNGQTKANVRKGSPRVLLNQQQPQFDTSQYQFVYEINHSQSFQLCTYLVPENILVGFSDEVPGIRDNFISFPERSAEVIELSATFAVFMSNVQVFIPEQLEQDVYKQVQKYRAYKYRVSEDYRGDIQITTKRLVAGYHNGWTVVNSRGLNNFVPLAESRKNVQEVIEGRNHSFKLLEYQGVIDVNNITSVDPQSDYNYGMLILQLEYEATFLVANLGKQTMQIILGWLPVYLNDKIGMPQEHIDEELIIGPGKTVTGKPLAYFSAQEVPIRVSAVLNLQGIGFQGMKELVKQAHSQPQQPAQQAAPTQTIGDRFKQATSEGDFDIKSQMKLREYEQQMQRLKEENERLRKGGPQQPIMAAPDDRQAHQRELDYLQAIDRLREENRVAQLSTSRQFEDLEKLLRLQATQRQVPQQRERGPSTGPGMDGERNVLFDRSDLQRYKPIEVTQYPLPQSTLRPISKADTAFLLQTGIPGLLDGDPEDSDLTAAELEQRTLAVELDDDRKDSVIIIQPLALKVYLLEDELSDAKSLGFNVPRNLFLTIHFYDLPQYMTPNLQLEFANDAKTMMFHLRNNTPLRILTIQEQTTHNVKFNIDTSTLRYNNLYMDFAQYLYRKCLLVDVWDADSRLLFGSLKIPLRGLLRQGKMSQHLLKEVDVLDTNFKRIKGSLQILIRNIGRQATNVGPELSLKDARQMTQATQVQDRAVVSKRKIVSEKPISGENVQQVSRHLVEDKDPEQRIMQRIKKLKMSNLSAVQAHDLSKGGTRKLNEVQKYKEFKKAVVVKGIVQEFLSSEKVLNSFFGKAELVPFVFKNPVNTAATYQVVIEDPDAKYLDMQEFMMVHNPAEWKFWCHFKGIPEPYSFDMVKVQDTDGRRLYYFHLESNEEITLLFKFLSFRPVDVNLQFDHDAFIIAQQRGKDYIQNNIYPRHVEIKLVRRENRQLVTELRVLIEPHMQVVDHVLRYYERDNRQSKIQLPPLYTFTQPPDKRPLVYVTDQNVVIEWGRDNNEIKLSFKVGEVCSVRRFNVLAYADPYNSELVGNWSIEVHSLAGYHNIISRSLDLEVPMGQQVVSRLTLPADVTRVVKLFCSHSSIITFPEQYKNEFTLVPGKLNIIEYFARSISETGIRAQINCVDVNSQDLIYAWILKVSAVPQPPSAVYEIKCQEGRDSKNSMSYLNSTNYLTTFRFDSSHPSYVMIVDSKLQIGPMERGEVRLRLPAKTGIQTLEAKVFISDLDERIFDTVLLKIRYTYN